jgi:5-methylcytosine-specific restriction endonuclease McrA
MTEFEVNRTVLLYCEVQLSAKELAKRFGVSAKTIVRRLRARGVPIRDKVAQRYSDKVFDRYDHGKRIRAAYAAGRYDTEAYKARRGGFRPGVDRAGESNPFFGRKHSALTRARLSRAAKARAIPGTGSYGAEWTPELRESVLARDSYQCRRCGRGECKLQVHHVDADRTNNDLMNLLTLCAACHLALHGRREGVDAVRSAAARSSERSAVRRTSRTRKGGGLSSGT